MTRSKAKYTDEERRAQTEGAAAKRRELGDRTAVNRLRAAGYVVLTPDQVGRGWTCRDPKGVFGNPNTEA